MDESFEDKFERVIQEAADAIMAKVASLEYRGIYHDMQRLIEDRDRLLSSLEYKRRKAMPNRAATLLGLPKYRLEWITNWNRTQTILHPYAETLKNANTPQWRLIRTEIAAQYVLDLN